MVPVWPGWHHVRVWHTSAKAPTPWHRRLNVAEMRLHVADAQALHVAYNTGVHSRKSLGRITVIGTSDGGGLPPLGTPPAFTEAARPASPRPPAGWYPDPAGRHAHRWWDGRAWSLHLSDTASGPGDPHLPHGHGSRGARDGSPAP